MILTIKATVSERHAPPSHAEYDSLSMTYQNNLPLNIIWSTFVIFIGLEMNEMT